MPRNCIFFQYSSEFHPGEAPLCFSGFNMSWYCELQHPMREGAASLQVHINWKHEAWRRSQYHRVLAEQAPEAPVDTKPA